LLNEVSMKERRWPVLWLVIGIVFGAATLLIPNWANAQTGVETKINLIQADDTPNQFGVTLRVFFTLIDKGSLQPLSSAEVKTAKYVLTDDNQTVDAKVEKATGPIFIVLVIDVNGQMLNRLKDIQAGATSLVNAAPPESQFAVVTFSDKVSTIQDFTNDRNKVNQAIAGIKAGGMICLYDGVFQGVQLVANVPKAARRAVVVFSGNKDLTFGNKQCSKHNPPEIVNLANTRDSRAPIYTLGYQGQQGQQSVDPALSSLSLQTGGTASVGRSPQSLFNDTTTSLNSQFVAEALVRPKEGDRQFSLQLTLASGATPDLASSRFTSPKDYSVAPTITPTITATPLPPEVRVTSVQQDPQTKEFIIEIAAVSENVIKEYRIDLISPTGTTQSSITKPSPIANPIRMQPGKMDDGDYGIRVSAVGLSGQVVAQSPDYRIAVVSTPTITPTATGTPPPISARILSIGYQDEATKLKIIVKLAVQSPDQIARFQAVLANKDTSVTQKEYPNVPVSSDVVLDLQGVPPGNYTVTINSFGANGQLLDTSTAPFGHTIELPTPTPTFTPIPEDLPSQIGIALRDPQKAPIVIGVIAVIVIGLLGLLAVIFLRKPKKAATGTGFLREMTGAVDVSELSSYAKNRTPAGGIKTPGAPPQAAAAKPAADYDKTAAVPYVSMPDSSVAVERSRDNTNVGKVIPLTHVPFRLGRRDSDLNFENDPGVSREHAHITYDNNVFYITDKGSTNHTFIDEVEVPAGVPKPLYSGATIRLGTSTVLKFRAAEQGGFDMDKTSPEPFKLS
jgi:FHA domain/von Willebrand factor type A domain